MPSRCNCRHTLRTPHLAVGLPDPLDILIKRSSRSPGLRNQDCAGVPPGVDTPTGQPARPCRSARPETVPVHVDEVVGHLLRRSSPPARNTRPSQAQDLVGPLQLPRTSRGPVPDPCGLGTADPVPLSGVLPACCRTGMQCLGRAADLRRNPTESLPIATGARCAARTPSALNSRTSGAYFVVFFMAPSSLKREPAKPGRFRRVSPDDTPTAGIPPNRRYPMPLDRNIA